jgi:hypothetical protein
VFMFIFIRIIKDELEESLQYCNESDSSPSSSKRCLTQVFKRLIQLACNLYARADIPQ